MIEENRHIEIFERHRNGDLTETEIREFDARLVYDSEFKEAFEAYKDLEFGIKTHFRNELKRKLKEYDDKIDASKSNKSSIKKLVIYSIAIAATLIIGVSLFQHFSADSKVILAKQYWPKERGIPVKMSNKGKYDDAMNAFKLGEFDKANELLQRIPSDTSDYFLGVIAYQQSNNSKAKVHFGQINKNSTYYQLAQFRLGLILLAEGNQTLAEKIFKSQIAENTEFADVSKEILEKI
jgi:hypothetical protein